MFTIVLDVPAFGHTAGNAIALLLLAAYAVHAFYYMKRRMRP